MLLVWACLAVVVLRRDSHDLTVVNQLVVSYVEREDGTDDDHSWY